MRKIDTYIVEKLKLNKDTSINNFSEIEDIIDNCIIKKFKNKKVSYSITNKVSKIARADNGYPFIIFYIKFDSNVDNNKFYDLGRKIIREIRDNSKHFFLYSVEYKENIVEVWTYEKN